MEQKFKKGDRVKVSQGHVIWDSKLGAYDLRPELKDDIATVEYTYGEKSETDSKYSKGERGYTQYCLKFDKHGEISWFDEKVITLL